MQITAEHALVGQKYKVTAVDESIEVAFEATLIDKIMHPPPFDWVSSLVFDNGVRISGMALELEPIL